MVPALEGADDVEINAGTGRRYTSISFNSGAETPDGEEYGTGAEALTDVRPTPGSTIIPAGSHRVSDAGNPYTNT